MNRSASGAQSSSLAPSVTASWCRTPWLGARRLSSGEPGAGSHDVATDRLVRLAPRLDALGPQPQVHVALDAARVPVGLRGVELDQRSEEHTSELQSLMRNSYSVFCL